VKQEAEGMNRKEAQEVIKATKDYLKDAEDSLSLGKEKEACDSLINAVNCLDAFLYVSPDAFLYVSPQNRDVDE
jgi:hypothetical protein